MSVEEQIKKYIDGQPELKRADIEMLHKYILDYTFDLLLTRYWVKDITE